MHRLIALVLLFCAWPAFADTAWPDTIASLRPDVSDSPIDAVLPAEVRIIAPGTDVPRTRVRWSGLWQGWACEARLCDVKVAVERVDDQGATVAYAGASAGGSNAFRGEAVFSGDELRLTLPSGSMLVLRLRADGDMEMSLWRPGPRLQAAGVLTRRPLERDRRTVERLPTPWTEDGTPIALVLVVHRPPQGSGPWPTLVMHHGSTGNGDRPELFKNVSASVQVARHFTAQGWQVIFPQRRGRGGSGGLYDEGFPPNRAGGYACDRSYSLPGAHRALSDVQLVMDHVAARPDVDARRILIGGISRGGILAATYAGEHPDGIRGVLNFVGGWSGERCVDAAVTNPELFRRAAAYPRPMLWLYGDRDPFYSLQHSRANFEAFRAAGGQGRFVAYDTERGQNGHLVANRPELWRADVDAYVREAAPALHRSP